MVTAAGAREGGERFSSLELRHTAGVGQRLSSFACVGVRARVHGLPVSSRLVRGGKSVLSVSVFVCVYICVYVCVCVCAICKPDPFFF